VTVNTVPRVEEEEGGLSRGERRHEDRKGTGRRRSEGLIRSSTSSSDAAPIPYTMSAIVGVKRVRTGSTCRDGGDQGGGWEVKGTKRARRWLRSYGAPTCFTV
jgi:hypothetical protein